MRLPDFKVEQWMNDYENDAIYNSKYEKMWTHNETLLWILA